MKIRITGRKIPKAQVGLISGALADMFNTSSLTDPQGVKDYFGRMGKTDYKADTQAVANFKLQQTNPGLGPTPEQQATQNTFATTPAAPTKAPETDPKNKFAQAASWYNKNIGTPVENAFQVLILLLSYLIVTRKEKSLISL
jgi:hypothetical protein